MIHPTIEKVLKGIKEMADRGKGFDVKLCEQLSRIVNRHNLFIEEAIKGDRGMETLCSENIDLIERANEEWKLKL